LLDAPTEIDACRVETRLQGFFRRSRVAHRPEALRILPARAHREEPLAGTLERTIHLHDIGGALAPEVEDDVALADHRRRLGHVLRERDAAPVEARHGTDLPRAACPPQSGPAPRAPGALRGPPGRGPAADRGRAPHSPASPRRGHVRPWRPTGAHRRERAPCERRLAGNSRELRGSWPPPPRRTGRRRWRARGAWRAAPPLPPDARRA